ncbi:hypothetical protein Clacol_001214 [Clathrus columnatus]|uniref:Uncharacterized protein n=1 Tax=Clathrus columnatus TaxID=1419009 RepID=A0AAV5A1Y1_9AGAM|nr:hypothetical protein Clacol_001214 [Clathrus columnatus]
MNATSTSTQTQLEASLDQSIPVTVGACLLGAYLAAVFYGVTLLQTYQYFSRYYGRDSIYLCVLVAILTLVIDLRLMKNNNSQIPLKSLGYLCGYIEHGYSVLLPYR